MSLPHWLREHVQLTDEAQLESEFSANVLNFPRGRADQRTDHSGQSALDLVYQAAELVSGMQDEARRRETRAKKPASWTRRCRASRKPSERSCSEKHRTSTIKKVEQQQSEECPFRMAVRETRPTLLFGCGREVRYH